MMTYQSLLHDILTKLPLQMTEAISPTGKMLGVSVWPPDMQKRDPALTCLFTINQLFKTSLIPLKRLLSRLMLIEIKRHNLWYKLVSVSVYGKLHFLFLLNSDIRTYG